MIPDFAEVRTVVANYLAQVPDEAWQLKTGKRDEDWTLHQTLSHLVAIAKAFNLAADCAIAGREFHTGKFERRDLVAWNETEIAERTNTSPQELTAQLVAELEGAEQRYANLSPEDAEKPLYLRVYNRPACAIDFLDWQLSHVGVIHAAQLTRPLNLPPLWEQFSPELSERQVDRFMRHFSYAYWQEFGNGMLGDIHFQIGSGDWFLHMNPQGGDYGQGVPTNPLFHIRFSNPQQFFGAFTFHISLLRSITSGEIVIEGDPKEALNILKLFSATPPM
jgi:hypothetical protein